MRVDVDEAGNDQRTARVELAVARDAVTDRDDPPAGDADVSPPPRRTRPVDDRPTADDELGAHGRVSGRSKW